jgi:hypothetical protein
MRSPILKSCSDTVKHSEALFESSKQQPQLGFASICLHDAVFRLKLLEEDILSHQDGLARLEGDEVSPIDTLSLQFNRIKGVLDQVGNSILISETTSLR